MATRFKVEAVKEAEEGVTPIKISDLDSTEFEAGRDYYVDCQQKYLSEVVTIIRSWGAGAPSASFKFFNFNPDGNYAELIQRPEDASLVLRLAAKQTSKKKLFPRLRELIRGWDLPEDTKVTITVKAGSKSGTVHGTIEEIPNPPGQKSK